jgi:hypothetical protein
MRLKAICAHLLAIYAAISAGRKAFDASPGRSETRSCLRMVTPKGWADINARDNDGLDMTALTCQACHNQSPKMISTLMKAIADIKAHDKIGTTGLGTSPRPPHGGQILISCLLASHFLSLFHSLRNRDGNSHDLSSVGEEDNIWIRLSKRPRHGPPNTAGNS